MSLSRPRLAVGLALAIALLTGCGSTSPGAAVQVGEDEISMSEIDDLTSEYCRAIERQLVGNAQTVPMRFFRGGVAGNLALRSAAEQVAEEYDVEPGEVYDEKVAQLEQSVAVLDEDVRESVVMVESSPAYVDAIQVAVGEQVLEDEGATSSEASEQLEAGRRVFEEWLAEEGVEFDPRLGVEVANGQVAPVDTSLSYPVGEDAEEGAKEQPDQTYAGDLPDAHRCG